MTSVEEMTSKRVAAESRDETLRIILRESLERYRNELLDMEERELLWDRIVRLRHKLGLNA